MKIRSLLAVLLILSMAPASLIIVSQLSLQLPWEPSRMTTVYTSLVDSSQSSLINTAEYSLKILFPYDFIEEGDEVPWKQLQRLYKYRREDYLLNESPEMYADRKIPELWKYAGLYRICRESGLDPANDSLSFVVIEAGLKAGVRLPPGGPEQEGRDLLSIHGPKGENISLNLPAANITDIIIIDRPLEGQGYPELKMTPDQWSLLIERMTPRIEGLAVDKGLLREAERGAVQLITDLFEGAGFEVDEIRFIP
ncbi:MAG: hypothetical protein B6241_00350 [Spirochaetaceae bacterium 4572_59]|nr:MAG: hypothetical protein B6241_00350 [Spirochaetaceae bacterium 4572_59]